MLLQVEDSNFIDDLARLDEFADIDVNLANLVNLTDLTLKAILSVTKDKLRTNDLFLMKSVTMRS